LSTTAVVVRLVLVIVSARGRLCGRRGLLTRIRHAVDNGQHRQRGRCKGRRCWWDSYLVHPQLKFMHHSTAA
jgi:hypothetical protein